MMTAALSNIPAAVSNILNATLELLNQLLVSIVHGNPKMIAKIPERGSASMPNALIMLNGIKRSDRVQNIR